MADPKVKQFMLAELQLQDEQVFSSVTARIGSSGTCWTGDVVLVRSVDNVNFVAGQVWLSTSVAEHGPFALVSLWSLESADKPKGVAMWRMSQAPTLVALRLLLAPVIWTEYRPGCAKTIIPPQFRGLSAVAE